MANVLVALFLICLHPADYCWTSNELQTDVLATCDQVKKGPHVDMNWLTKDDWNPWEANKCVFTSTQLTLLTILFTHLLYNFWSRYTVHYSIKHTFIFYHKKKAHACTLWFVTLRPFSCTSPPKQMKFVAFWNLTDFSCTLSLKTK